MGFYSRFVFPHLCELALDQPFVARHRRDLLQQAEGDILEIGFGTGLNLAHYPQATRKITVVDPNPGMLRRAQRRIEQSPIEVDLHRIHGERLPFANDTFDCAVSTFTLCSIEKVNQAVGEVCRVLKPGGKFLFLEHGLSPDPQVQAWQRRLNWLQQRLADHCRLDRNIQEVVARQPFAQVRHTNFYLEKGPRTHAFMYQGVAVK